MGQATKVRFYGKTGDLDGRMFSCRFDSERQCLYFEAEGTKPGDVLETVEFREALVVADYNDKSQLIGLEIIA